MGGGLMQLVAYGAQDVYLTGNPQITFFKVVYRRHTNFSMESIQQTLIGNSASGTGGRVVATISRNGDLLYKTFIVLPPMNAPGILSAEYGHQIIDHIDVEIGGQIIDRHYGHFMEAWSELTEPNPTRSIGYLTGLQYTNNLLNNTFLPHTAGSYIENRFTNFQRMACAGGVNGSLGGGVTFDPVQIDQPLTIPLRFWFCKEPGLALPLIALQYHEVKVIIQFSKALQHDKPELWCDYIYLDTDERRRFAQVSHEYLIEQVQVERFTTKETKFTCKLKFNHPVKELIWFKTTNTWNTTSDNVAFFTLLLDTDVNKCSLKLNGHERFAPRPMQYFTRDQPYLYHTSSGVDRNILAPVSWPQGSNYSDTIGVYSFCLKPEEHQPSGTCNFSRLDSVELIIEGINTELTGDDGPGVLNVCAINYNVLRIMSGMGGLAYSN